MSVFGQNQVQAAAPFQTINPSGVDPTNAITQIGNIQQSYLDRLQRQMALRAERRLREKELGLEADRLAQSKYEFEAQMREAERIRQEVTKAKALQQEVDKNLNRHASLLQRLSQEEQRLLAEQGEARTRVGLEEAQRAAEHLRAIQDRKRALNKYMASLQVIRSIFNGDWSSMHEDEQGTHPMKALLDSLDAGVQASQMMASEISEIATDAYESEFTKYMGAENETERGKFLSQVAESAASEFVSKYKSALFADEADSEKLTTRIRNLIWDLGNAVQFSRINDHDTVEWYLRSADSEYASILKEAKDEVQVRLALGYLIDKLAAGASAKQEALPVAEAQTAETLGAENVDEEVLAPLEMQLSMLAGIKGFQDRIGQRDGKPLSTAFEEMKNRNSDLLESVQMAVSTLVGRDDAAEVARRLSLLADDDETNDDFVMELLRDMPGQLREKVADAFRQAARMTKETLRAGRMKEGGGSLLMLKEMDDPEEVAAFMEMAGMQPPEGDEDERLTIEEAQEMLLSGLDDLDEQAEEFSETAVTGRTQERAALLDRFYRDANNTIRKIRDRAISLEPYLMSENEQERREAESEIQRLVKQVDQILQKYDLEPQEVFEFLEEMEARDTDEGDGSDEGDGDVGFEEPFEPGMR